MVHVDESGHGITTLLTVVILDFVLFQRLFPPSTSTFPARFRHISGTFPAFPAFSAFANFYTRRKEDFFFPARCLISSRRFHVDPLTPSGFMRPNIASLAVWLLAVGLAACTPRGAGIADRPRGAGIAGCIHPPTAQAARFPGASAGGRLRGGCGDAGDDAAAEDALRGMFEEPAAFFEPPPLPGRASYRRPSDGQLVQLVTSGRSPLWGHLVWNAARVIADYIDGNPALVLGKSVLELGAGAGLPAIVAALNGAKCLKALTSENFRSSNG